MTTKQNLVNTFNETVSIFHDAVKSAQFSEMSSPGATGSQTATNTESVSETIRLEYNTTEVDNNSVMIGDFKLMLRVDDLTFRPRAGNLVVWDDLDVTVISVRTDALSATHTVQVREQ